MRVDLYKLSVVGFVYAMDTELEKRRIIQYCVRRGLSAAETIKK